MTTVSVWRQTGCVQSSPLVLHSILTFRCRNLINASARGCFGEIFSGIHWDLPLCLSLNIAPLTINFSGVLLPILSHTHRYAQATLSQFLLRLERPRGTPTRLHLSSAPSLSHLLPPLSYLYAASFTFSSVCTFTS